MGEALLQRLGHPDSQFGEASSAKRWGCDASEAIKLQTCRRRSKLCLARRSASVASFRSRGIRVNRSARLFPLLRLSTLLSRCDSSWIFVCFPSGPPGLPIRLTVKRQQLRF